MERKKLEKRHNIVINYLKENSDEIKHYSGMILLGTSILVGYCLYQHSQEVEKARYRYNNSTVLSETGNYSLNDLYLLSINCDHYYCKKQEENNSQKYVYADINTGNIICREKDEDVVIYKLSDIELQDILKSYDYHININQLDQELTYRYLSGGKQKTL